MRMGKKKQPTYRVVAADSRSPRDGRFIEILGTYQPRAEPSVVQIDNGQGGQVAVRGRAADRDRGQAAQAVRRLGRVQGGSRPAHGDDRRPAGARLAKWTARSGVRWRSAVLEYLAKSIVDDAGRRHDRRGRGPAGRHPALAARRPRRHGQGDRQAGPGGPGHPHRRPGRRGTRGHRGQRRHRRLAPVRCSRSAGSSRPTASGAKSSSNWSPTATSGWRRVGPGRRPRTAGVSRLAPVRGDRRWPWIVTFDGVVDRRAAEALRGTVLPGRAPRPIPTRSGSTS